MAFLSNVFYDPSNPWYYVVGVVFLLLVFGALAIYIVLSKKYTKKSDGEENKSQVTEPDAKNESDAAEPDDIVIDTDKNSEGDPEVSGDGGANARVPDSEQRE